LDYHYILEKKKNQAPVAHTCNPSYSGGRDQEDLGSKPAPGKSFERPYLKKNPSQKRAGGMAQGVGPEFKPRCQKKKKNRRVNQVLGGGGPLGGEKA
jgi:hypothetical protein